MSQSRIPFELPAGTMIAGYEIVRALGAGGFGITYEGFNPVTERRVAIKEFFPRGIASRESATQIVFAPSERELAEWALRRFRESTTALARLNHRNIVGVLNYVAEHGTGYMVMEHIDGETLERWLRAKASPPSLDDLRPVLDPVCDALEYIHGRNILHRDIAPDNVMIASDLRPVLIDFGAIKVIEEETLARSGTSFPVGKRFYSPPEQFTSQPLDARTDIYALAAVIYRALAGTPPADAEYRKGEIVEGRPDPYKPIASLPGVSIALPAAEAIDRALSVRRDLRPDGVAGFRDLLQWNGIKAPARAAASPFGFVPPAPPAADSLQPATVRADPPAGPSVQPRIEDLLVSKSWLDNASLIVALAIVGGIAALGALYVLKPRPDPGVANPPPQQQARDERPPIKIPVPSPSPPPVTPPAAAPIAPPAPAPDRARAWIGVRIQAVNAQLAETLNLPQGEGVLIVSVAPEGPAQRAGLVANDVILRVNGKPVAATAEVGELLDGIGVGGTATLTIHRLKGPKEVRVAIASSNGAEAVATRHSNAWLGLVVKPLDMATAEKEKTGVTAGALVVNYDLYGAAVAAGIMRGDVIIGADGEEIRSAGDLFSVIGRRKIGNTIDIVVFRAGKAMTVKATLRELPAAIRPAKAPRSTPSSADGDRI